MLRKIKSEVRTYFWKLLKLKFKLKSGLRVTINNDTDFVVFQEIFINKEYETAINSFLSQDLNDPLILDLGANVGYFSLRISDELLLKNVDKFSCYCIEASVNNFNTLLKRIDQPLLKDKISAVCGLAGFKNGSSYLSTNTVHFGYGVTTQKLKGEEVKYINIDELIGDGNRQVDLLKCDIEGSEEDFLSSYPSLLQRTQMAVIEFHHDAINFDKCSEYLSNAGLLYVATLNSDPRYNTSVRFYQKIKKSDNPASN